MVVEIQAHIPTYAYGNTLTFTVDRKRKLPREGEEIDVRDPEHPETVMRCLVVSIEGHIYVLEALETFRDR